MNLARTLRRMTLLQVVTDLRKKLLFAIIAGCLATGTASTVHGVECEIDGSTFNTLQLTRGNFRVTYELGLSSSVWTLYPDMRHTYASISCANCINLGQPTGVIWLVPRRPGLEKDLSTQEKRRVLLHNTYDGNWVFRDYSGSLVVVGPPVEFQLGTMKGEVDFFREAPDAQGFKRDVAFVRAHDGCGGIIVLIRSSFYSGAAPTDGLWPLLQALTLKKTVTFDESLKNPGQRSLDEVMESLRNLMVHPLDDPDGSN